MADGQQIQDEWTYRDREKPWITRVEFRTEYEDVEELIKETTIEVVRVQDPDDETRVSEKRIPRETTRVIKKRVPVEWVSWALRATTSGNVPSTCSDKVARIMKNQQLWPFLQPKHEAWKKQQEPPLDGTPLDTWPGVTMQQAKILRENDIKTVEDFATAPSGMLMKMSIPGILEMQKRAVRFLEAAGFLQEAGQQKFAAEISIRDEKITELERRNAERDAEMTEMKETIAMLAATRRGPGRPSKAEQEALNRLDQEEAA
jgi:hypothetical protein